MTKRANKPGRGATVVCANVVGQPIGERVRLDRRRRRLSAVVKRHVVRARPYIVSVHRPGDILRPEDHTLVAREEWVKTLVPHDSVILITYLPAGGGGSGSSTGKQVGAALGLLALSLAAPYAVGALGIAALGTITAAGVPALTFAGSILALGITAAGAYAISAATRAKASGAEVNNADDVRPLYGVSGGGNLPRKGDRIPVGYGRTWMQPDLSQPDYAIYNGEDVIWYKRMTLGLGKYDVEKIQVGAATLWTAAGGVQPPFGSIPGGGVVGGRSDSERSQSSGTGGASAGLTAVEIIPPGGTSTLVPGSVYTAPSVGGTELPRYNENPAWSGPWAVCPVGQTTKRIQLDYQVPALMLTDSDAYPVTFAVVFQYAPCDDDDEPTGAWSVLHSNTIVSRWTRANRFTRIIDVPDGRYIVRGQNLRPYSDTTIDAVIWDGLRAHFEETIVRPHVTEIALRIRSGKATAAVSFSDIWVKSTRILPVWDSETEEWVEQPTRKAVWAFLDVMQSSYGGNLDDTRVDHERAKYYATALTEFDTFDGVIRGPVSVRAAASVVLGPMRAEPVMIGSQWTIARDEPRSVRKHIFTRRQISRSTSQAHFEFARNTGEADVIVEYTPDGDARRRNETRKTFGTQSLTPKRYNLTGVSDWRHAQHLATWLAASAFSRRQDRTIVVDRQGRIVTRSDPVAIDCWFLTDAKIGGVMATAGRLLTLDTDVGVGADSYAELRDRSGRTWGPIKVTVPDPSHPKRIELDAADLAVVEAFYDQLLSDVLAHDSEDMTTVRVGALQELQEAYLVQSVVPHSRDSIEIKALRDAPEVWTALAEELPPEPPLPSAAVSDPYPVVPWVRARCVQKALSLEMEWSCGTARGAASYVVLLSYDDGETYETVSTGQPNSGSHPLRHVEGQTVQVVAYAIDAAGVPGPAVATTLTTAPAIVVSDDFDAGLRERFMGGLAADLLRLRQRIDDLALSIADTTDNNWNDKKLVRTDLVASEGRSNARITSVESVAASETEAVALRVDDLEATVDTPTTGLTARVTTTEAAIADSSTGLAASASRISDLEVTVDTPTTGLTARVTTTEAAISDIEGNLTAVYGVAVDAYDNGASLVLLADGSGSAIKLDAEQILLDGSVVADKIGAREIDAGKIAIDGVDILNLIDGSATGGVSAAGSDADAAMTIHTPDAAFDFTSTANVTLASVSFDAEIGTIDVDVQTAFSYSFIVLTSKKSTWFHYIETLVDGVVKATYAANIIWLDDFPSSSYSKGIVTSPGYRSVKVTGVSTSSSITALVRARTPANYYGSAAGSPGTIVHSQNVVKVFERRN